MRQLRYAGPGEDAGHVVVEALDASDRFTLVLDDAMRAAARQELPRPGRSGGSGDATSLSPREIQTRVRSGTSPELVAEEAELPLDKVMRFAYPVLQERARVADEARRARARHAGGAPDAAALGEVVDGGFAAYGIDPAEVAWDSFRRLDGQWTVTAAWREDDTDRYAQWSFALAVRTVTPLDDAADDLQHGRPLRPLVAEPPAEVVIVVEGLNGRADGGLPGDDRDGPPVPGSWDTGWDGEATGPAVRAGWPTGPIPPALRLAPPPAGSGSDGDPFAGDPWPGDPAPRGLGSLFTDSPPTPNPVPHPSAGAPTGAVDEGVPPAAEPDPGEPLLPFAFDPSAAGAPRPAGRRPGRHAHAASAANATDADGDPKAARARIPSWDDILLGVRRRGD